MDFHPCRRTGSLGMQLATVFIRKNLGAFSDAGAVTTNDRSNWATGCAQLRNYGLEGKKYYYEIRASTRAG